MSDSTEYVEQIRRLEREVRILQKKLQRSEADREQLEDTKDKNDSLQRNVIGELRESQAQIALKSRELEKTVEELKAAQDELIESAKMASLGQLVAGVAHEVNTPLGVGVTAASHLDNLAKEFSDYLEGPEVTRESANRFIEGTRQSSEIILKNLRRASELIASFKLVAVDQSIHSTREYNIYEYLGEIMLSLSNRLKRARVEVLIEGDPTLTVSGDPGVLSQIITNLVMNAVIHAYDDGDSGLLKIRFEDSGENICIEFEDDGKGIDSGHLSKIFDPFFTTRRGSGGSGLGLNIVYNLIRGQVGGKIECFSTLGKGTRFVMSMPKVQVEPIMKRAEMS